MQAQRILKPIKLVKKNAEIERLGQELAALNARIEELEKAASRSIEDRGTEGKRACAGAAD
jgi:prefoldin subunit 5